MSEDEECGESFDHRIVIRYEDEFVIQWECLVCGAEGEDLKADVGTDD